MKISWKWLGDWVDLEKVGSPEKLAEILTARGLEVEAVHRLDAGFEHVVTAQILERLKHPEADRLSVCTVSTGAAPYLQIVCGAQNMKRGDVVALAQIGAKLPNGLKIEKSKIRGTESFGMLCSEEELGLKDKAEGILILPEGTPVGWKLADVLERDDVILDIKLTANRGDCLSHYGIAREVSAALGLAMKTQKIPTIAWTNASKEIELLVGDDAPQFAGALIKGVIVKDSPAWMKTRLESVGQRPVNNLVDVGNFVMLDLGFPVHIYDADLLDGDSISVQKAEQGEELSLLDGATVKLQGFELVIRDGKKSVGLAGVMGGGNSEVRPGTKNIFLECAEFSPVLVRRAASVHARRSEASLRFEKGIDPKGPELAMYRLADLVARVAGGVFVGASLQQNPNRKDFCGTPVQFSETYISQQLGMDISVDEVTKILVGLHCDVKQAGGKIHVTPPSFRRDLNIPEDFIEEIARCVGYDRIPTTLPFASDLAARPARESAVAQRLARIELLKDAFVSLGFSEAVSLSFQSEAFLKRCGYPSQVRVQNPLTEEHESLVPSLLPGLFKASLENERHHFGSEPLSIRLFEVRPTFLATESKIEASGTHSTGVKETLKAAFVLCGRNLQEAMRQDLRPVDFFDLKGSLEDLFARTRTSGVRLLAATRDPVPSTFHPGQAIEVWVGKSRVGHAGRLHPRLEKELGLRQALFVCEFDLDAALPLMMASEAQFKDWPKFPGMERDFALVVDEKTPSDRLVQVGIRAGKPIAKAAKVFDIYRGSSLPAGKVSVAIRVQFGDAARSLEEAEVERASGAMVDAWTRETGATLR
jgi:phenylalanyl-tRNA synthetase beta chain